VHALVFCTSERCTGTWAHMLLWFQCTSVTRSVSSDSAIIDDLGCDHQVMMFYEDLSQSSGPIRSKCHSLALALMFCTTERCTYCQSTLVTRLVRVESNATVNGELGSAAHCIMSHIMSE